MNEDLDKIELLRDERRALRKIAKMKESAPDFCSPEILLILERYGLVYVNREHVVKQYGFDAISQVDPVHVKAKDTAYRYIQHYRNTTF